LVIHVTAAIGSVCCAELHGAHHRQVANTVDSCVRWVLLCFSLSWIAITFGVAQALVMSDQFVSLPLGEDNPLENDSPSAPPLYQPRPPPNAPIGMAGDDGEVKFEVTVSDPTKSGSGYQAFVSYKVTCQTNLRQYQSPNISVNRRFNHFVWLHAQLSEQYPCYFIPALPDKQGITSTFNKFSEEFVEARRMGLQQYLHRVALHPVLAQSKPLQVFFEGEENAMRLPEEKKSGFFSGLMKDLTPRTTVPQDPEFDAMKLSVKELEAQLSEVHKFMERLIRRRKDLGGSLAELGLTLITMGNHEQQAGDGEAASTSKSFHDLGSCCDHLSISFQKQSDDETRKSLMVIDEWLRIAQGAQEALRLRASALGHHLALSADLERKHKALTSGSQAGKNAVTESDVTEARRKVLFSCLSAQRLVLIRAALERIRAD